MRLPSCNCCNTNINLEARKIFKQRRKKTKKKKGETRACGFSIYYIVCIYGQTLKCTMSGDTNTHTLMTGALIYVRLQFGSTQNEKKINKGGSKEGRQEDRGENPSSLSFLGDHVRHCHWGSSIWLRAASGIPWSLNINAGRRIYAASFAKLNKQGSS